MKKGAFVGFLVALIVLAAGCISSQSPTTSSTTAAITTTATHATSTTPISFTTSQTSTTSSGVTTTQTTTSEATTTQATTSTTQASTSTTTGSTTATTTVTTSGSVNEFVFSGNMVIYWVYDNTTNSAISTGTMTIPYSNITTIATQTYVVLVVNNDTTIVNDTANNLVWITIPGGTTTIYFVSP